MSEIRLRAETRIGEISRQLEKAQYDKGHDTVVPSSGKYKEQQPAEAGLSTSANRYEELSAYTQALAARLSASFTPLSLEVVI
jgi:hypothetical protein